MNILSICSFVIFLFLSTLSASSFAALLVDKCIQWTPKTICVDKKLLIQPKVYATGFDEDNIGLPAGSPWPVSYTHLWEKGVVFKEVITDWTPNKRMAYAFDIDPDAIPDDALDQHVKLGGDYFSPIFGEYQITTNNAGNTILHLKTTLRDNTNFGIYSRMWGEIIFQDFHMSLLTLMKHRSENLLRTTNTFAHQ